MHRAVEEDARRSRASPFFQHGAGHAGLSGPASQAGRMELHHPPNVRAAAVPARSRHSPSPSHALVAGGRVVAITWVGPAAGSPAAPPAPQRSGKSPVADVDHQARRRATPILRRDERDGRGAPRGPTDRPRPHTCSIRPVDDLDAGEGSPLMHPCGSNVCPAKALPCRVPSGFAVEEASRSRFPRALCHGATDRGRHTSVQAEAPGCGPAILPPSMVSIENGAQTESARGLRRERL